MNTNRNIRVSAAVLLALSMSSVLLPIHADGDDGITKNEDVFIVLNPDGSVNKTTVSDTLHSDSGFNNYNDVSNLKDAQNLKNTDDLQKSSDGYVWNTSDKDIYYQGSYDGDLPLQASITYTLDGKTVKEEDLLGETGHLKMTITLTNQKSNSYTVNGKTYTVTLPIAAVTGAMFSKDHFSNLSVTSGNVTSDSSHDIVACVSLPGLKDSLSSLLTKDSLTSIDDYLNDEVTIEADVDEYEAPEVMIAAATNLDELKTELGGTDLSSVWSDIDKLQSATTELLDGTNTLNDGASQLVDGSNQLESGTNDLLTGSAKLADGASQLADGASDLSKGLAELSGNSATLNAGAKQIQESVFATASQQLSSQTGKTIKLTTENYADVLAELLKINDTERAQAKTTIKQSLDAAVTAQTGQPSDLDDATVNALIYLASVHSTDAGFEKDIATQAARLLSAQTVQGYAKNYTSKAATLINTTVQAILSAIVSAKQASTYTLTDAEYAATKAQMIATARAQAPQLSAYTDEQVMAYLLTNQYGGAPEAAVVTAAFKKSIDSSMVYDAISQQLKATSSSLDDATIAAMITYTADQYNTLDADSLAKTADAFNKAAVVQQEMAASATTEGQQKIKSTLNVIVASSKTYKDSAAQINELQTSLDGLVSFVTGLKKYTDGVDDCYDGSKTLASKTSELADGAAELHQGVTTLKAGVDALADGINTLKTGTETLMNGMNEYNSEGIAKITGSTETTDLRNATDLLTQMKNSSNSYNNYSGISEGTDGSVKFIYKVKTIKTEKESTAVASTDDVTHVNDGSNIWSRIVNLFVFWK